MERRKRENAAEVSPTPNPSIIDVGTQVHGTSEYEQSREQRIKENLERMQNLGIVNLSLKLKADSLSKKRNARNHQPEKRTPLRSPLPTSAPIRRSSRLQNLTPVSYSELDLTKKNNSSSKDDNGVFTRERGAQPEIYTKEHEKLLGNTERSWTLFVDGYASDGRRIYDPVKGKTCHQCRQKTLGLRTHCSKCQMVQGQFCGDCLYMRYGEHVVEANENHDWICPVCRGICNCSLCRQAKGWPPTGPLYRRISKLGFKSVAHYLVQSNHAPSDSEGNNADNLHPARRSLAFDEMKVGCEVEGSPKPLDNKLEATLENHNKGGSESNEEKDMEVTPFNKAKLDCVAGRTRKRGRLGNAKGNDELMQKEITEDKTGSDNDPVEIIEHEVNTSASPLSGQGSIAGRLRTSPRKPLKFSC